MREGCDLVIQIGQGGGCALVEREVGAERPHRPGHAAAHVEDAVAGDQNAGGLVQQRHVPRCVSGGVVHAHAPGHVEHLPVGHLLGNRNRRESLARESLQYLTDATCRGRLAGFDERSVLRVHHSTTRRGLGQQLRRRPGVVVVRVGEDDALHITRVLADVGQPGDDALARAPNPGIDQGYRAVLFDEGERIDEVAQRRDAPDLWAQRYRAHVSCCCSGSPGSAGSPGTARRA